MLLAVVAVVSAWAGNPVGATVVSRPSPAAGTGSCTTSCSRVSLHPGGVVQHGQIVHLILWLPSTPSGLYLPPSYGPDLSTWLADAAAGDFTAGNVFSVAQQYYDLSGPGGTRNFVQYAMSAVPALVVTDPLPPSACTDKVPGSGAAPYCLTDAQIQGELRGVITAGNLPQNTNTSYVLFTPNSVGSCRSSASTKCAYANYCGYHSFFAGPKGPIVYSDMPWLYGMQGCDPQVMWGFGYPNGSPADPEVGMLSRQLIGMMTDPILNGWSDSTGHEIGDKCSFEYGPGGVGSTSGLHDNGLGEWNEALNGDQYLLPLEFSNHDSNQTTTGCVGRDTDSQPLVKVTVTPNPPVHGAQVRLTASITDPAGVYRTRWNFGDGVSAYGSSVSHTYVAPGPETIIFVVTDNHGNETQVKLAVNVA
jgi:hypothetical protein